MSCVRVTWNQLSLYGHFRTPRSHQGSVGELLSFPKLPAPGLERRNTCWAAGKKDFAHLKRRVWYHAFEPQRSSRPIFCVATCRIWENSRGSQYMHHQSVVTEVIFVDLSRTWVFTDLQQFYHSLLPNPLNRKPHWVVLKTTRIWTPSMLPCSYGKASYYFRGGPLKLGHISNHFSIRL